MQTPNAWQIILAASLVSYALRALPFLLVSFLKRGIPKKLESALELSGFAIIGSLMGESIFSPSINLDYLTLKVAFVFLAFGLMLVLRRQLLCLFTTYSLFLCVYVFYFNKGRL